MLLLIVPSLHCFVPLPFTLLSFGFINFQQTDADTDMSGEPADPGGSSLVFEGLFFWSRSCPQRPRKHHYSRFLLRLCGQQAGSTHIPFSAELCLDTTVKKKKKNSPTKGSGLLRERVCVCLWLSISPSCSFGPRQGFLWPLLNKESIPFPCKDDFSSKFSVCTAAKMLAYNFPDL